MWSLQTVIDGSVGSAPRSPGGTDDGVTDVRRPYTTLAHFVYKVVVSW
jgi:hypothetical protein